MPYRLRYQMAWNHGLSRAVLRVYTRALRDVYRRGARARGIAGGQTDMVTALQRAGGALNANLHFHTPVLDGSIRGWLRVIDELSTLPAQRVIPGHGPVSEWPAALTDQRRYLETLASDVRMLVARGEPITVAADTAAASERARWQLFDDYNARNATTAFSEIEWE